MVDEFSLFNEKSLKANEMSLRFRHGQHYPARRNRQ